MFDSMDEYHKTHGKPTYWSWEKTMKDIRKLLKEKQDEENTED